MGIALSTTTMSYPQYNACPDARQVLQPSQGHYSLSYSTVLTSRFFSSHLKKMSFQNRRKLWGSFKHPGETKQPQELTGQRRYLGQFTLPKGQKKPHFAQNHNVPF